MKDFGDRHTDFGESHIPAPFGTRWIDIRVGKETWRIELEPDEVANVMLREELEQQANDFNDLAAIVIATSDRPRG